MLTIYGHPMSTCTRKVLTTVAELSIPHEFVLVDFAKGEHKQPAHLARQPFGKVPAIDDDGFKLYESRAICRYLNEQAGGGLAPADARAVARIGPGFSIATARFTGRGLRFGFHPIFTRGQDEATLAAARAGMEEALGVMEAALAQQPFIAGETFSLADIAFMPYVEYTMATPAKEIYAPYPAVNAWWARVSERPSWRKVTGRAGA